MFIIFLFLMIFNANAEEIVNKKISDSSVEIIEKKQVTIEELETQYQTLLEKRKNYENEISDIDNKLVVIKIKITSASDLGVKEATELNEKINNFEAADIAE